MKKFKNLLSDFSKDESAQGATEYILLLVVVVGIALMFRGRIEAIMTEKIGQLAGDIGQF